MTSICCKIIVSAKKKHLLRDQELVGMWRHCDHIREALPVDNWNASIIMVVILVPTLAILPIIIQSHITKAQVAQGGGNSIHFTLLGHHSIHDALHQRLIPSWTLSHPLTNRSFGGSHSLRRWTKYLKAPATYIGYIDSYWIVWISFNAVLHPKTYVKVFFCVFVCL